MEMQIGHPKKMRVENKKLIDKIRKKPCAATEYFGCSYDPIVVHHVISEGSGGPDLPWNLLPIRNSLHTPVIHVLGISRMARRYPKFKKWLLFHNWEYNEIHDEWAHSREEG